MDRFQGGLAHGPQKRIVLGQALEREAGISLRKSRWDNDLATRYGLRVSPGVSEGCKPYYPLGLRQKRRDLEVDRSMIDRLSRRLDRLPARTDTPGATPPRRVGGVPGARWTAPDRGRPYAATAVTARRSATV